MILPSLKELQQYVDQVPAVRGVTGVILSDQVKCLDWRTRKAELADRIPEDTVHDVSAGCDADGFESACKPLRSKVLASQT